MSPIADVICRACSKKGHMANICRNKNKKSTNFIDLHTHQNDSISNNFVNFSNLDETACDTRDRTDEDSGIFSINAEKKNGMASAKFKLTVNINGILFEEVKCDTGAPCSLMSIGTFDKFFDRRLLKFGHNPYTDYGNHPLSYVGEFSADVMYRNETSRVTFIVTKASQPILLGETFLDPFRFKLIQVNAIAMKNDEKKSSPTN